MTVRNCFLILLLITIQLGCRHKIEQVNTPGQNLDMAKLDLKRKFKTIHFEEHFIEKCFNSKGYLESDRITTHVNFDLINKDSVCVMLNDTLVQTGINELSNNLILDYKGRFRNKASLRFNIINVDTAKRNVFRMYFTKSDRELVFELKKFSPELLIKENHGAWSLVYNSCLELRGE